MERQLTTRGIIYTNWNCNLDCDFCYYRFKPKFQRPLRDVKADLIKAKFYYNLNWIDISGGEPTVYKHLKEVLMFCKVIGLKVTVITNGICITKELDELVDEWLISIHGTKDIHNKMVKKSVFSVVENNIKSIKKPFRVNLVITKDNYKNFPKQAVYLGRLKHKPTRVHYIMFNPFHEFSQEADIPFLANPDEVGEYLKEAIEILKERGIDSVVRYLPFCMAKGFEDKVCGMSQISYDFGEWDWCQQLNADARLKNDDQYYMMARNTAVNNSTIMKECRGCAAEFICDGVGISYLKRFDSLKPKPIKGEKIFDPLYFQEERGEERKVEPPLKRVLTGLAPLPSSSEPLKEGEKK